VVETGADGTLSLTEAFPEPQAGAAAEMGRQRVQGPGEAVGDDPLEKAGEGMGGEAKASELVGEPDAAGASAAGPVVAVAAEDAMSAEGGMAGSGVIVAAEETVTDEVARGVAVGTSDEFESWDEGVPVIGGMVEPRQIDHGRASSTSDEVEIGRRGGAG
jgi:hypothetical protein